MGNTLPLTYDTLNGKLTTPSIFYKELLRESQSPASGATLNFSLGSLILDAAATSVTYTFPIYTASNNGSQITIQKTSSTNHTITITAGTGNQIALNATNVLSNTHVIGLTTYQESFRFINPNWFPF